MTALALSALAEAAHPYGIVSFDRYVMLCYVMCVECMLLYTYIHI